MNHNFSVQHRFYQHTLFGPFVIPCRSVINCTATTAVAVLLLHFISFQHPPAGSDYRFPLGGGLSLELCVLSLCNALRCMLVRSDKFKNYI